MKIKSIIKKISESYLITALVSLGVTLAVAGSFVLYVWLTPDKEENEES